MPASLPDKTLSGLIDTNETGRSSRFSRPEPIRMHLTLRDEQIITRCWEDKLLTTSDLHRLFFGAKARCVQRLRTLYSNYYLDRYFFPIRTPYHGATEALYTIGTKGSHIVSLRLEQQPNYVSMKRREFNVRMQSPSFLLTFRHLRTVIKTRICIEEAFAQSKQWGMIRWIPERLLEDQFTLDVNGTVRRAKIRGDGFFQYQHRASGQTYSAFVETDLATMSHKQIASKVSRYLNYFQTELPLRRYGTRWYRVLFITTSQKRASELSQTINQEANSIFWLTSFDELLKTSWLTTPIWLRVGHEGKHPLLPSSPPVS